MNHKSQKNTPKNKVKIEGVGAFDLDALQGAKKADVAAHFAHLPEDQAKQHSETLWKAVSKGEMPEEKIEAPE